MGDRRTSEEIVAMGYDPEVVEYFQSKAPELLEFMWGQISAHYSSILKNTIPSEKLIQTALTHIELENRVGNVALTSLLMADFRLHHPKASNNRE